MGQVPVDNELGPFGVGWIQSQVQSEAHLQPDSGQLEVERGAEGRGLRRGKCCLGVRVGPLGLIQ